MIERLEFSDRNTYDLKKHVYTITQPSLFIIGKAYLGREASFRRGTRKDNVGNGD